MQKTVQGESNNVYVFNVLNNFDVPSHISNCVYIYGDSTSVYTDIKYVGITIRPLAERHQEHKTDGKWQCARENGANSIWYLSRPGNNYSKNELEAIEKDILGRYQTPCNIKNN